MSTVLLVEDEMNLALMMEDVLTDAGYIVIKASRMPRALALAASKHIDVAVLDINLDGVEVFPVALELHQRGVPFAFTSGYGASGLPAEYRDCPILPKPYYPEQLVREVAALLAGAARAT